MDLSLIARGGVPLKLDRERIVFFGFRALALIVAKYGDEDLYSQLYTAKRIPDPKGKSAGHVEARIKDVDALAFYLWAGLQEDLVQGETLTLERVQQFLCPVNFRAIGNAVVMALVTNTASPPQPGKAEAATERPPAAAKKARASTSQKRHGSRSRSSAGYRKPSGTGR